MTIGFDARFYGSNGGIPRYVQQLLNHLTKIDTTNQYVVFLGEKNIQEFETGNKNFKKTLANARWYTLKEQIIMPWKIWRQKIDLMHFPHWNVPLLYRGKFIVTIHDLILLKYPSKKATTLSPLFFAIKYWAYKKVLRHAIYDSRKIIAPSEFVKKDILANFKVSEEKIIVIYEGSGMSSARHCEDSPTAVGEDEAIPCFNGIASLRSRYRIAEIARNDVPKKPYLLYVGVAYPHKNLEGMIKAFQIFCDQYSQDYHLILVGQENYFYRRLKKIISNIQYPISYLGFIPDSQLPDLYQNASLYLFPSFYEGFGLPGLEAMSCGLPVLASNSSCLPEIYGQAALYFNPRDPAEMADLINTALSNKNLQEGLRQKGFEQVKKYSWERMARETLEVYLN